ncbi:carbohydrate ABC transporter permease [Treponema succinifaciens]|uniref:carbohydrate ABC transporter permease n=1 Tax=Treponema succinifaciens TaxID=167 RepID=UPI00258619B7|nr:carbohydrate ABC transporter permease [Treponema succinifaciens]MDY2615160.1 carbohydrate ABC transporter permease [Treponema succinifaciens]
MEKLKSQAKMLSTRRIICYAVLVLLAILSLFPFYIMVVNATRSHPQIQSGFSAIPGTQLWLHIKQFIKSERWFDVVAGQQVERKVYGTSYPIFRGLGNSFLVAIFTAAFTTYFSAMTAYGIYMYNFKGKKSAFKFIMAVMMVPTQVSTLGFLQLITKLGIMNSYIPLIIPAIAAPVVFFYMYQSMEATLPYSIVEAARVDGSNEFYTFNAIVCPMLKPAFAVQSIFAFVSSWNNYFVPALVISDKKLWTVPIVIANARSADYMMFDLGVNYTLMTVAILPLIVIYFLLSRYIIGGVTAGGVKE